MPLYYLPGNFGLNKDSCYYRAGTNNYDVDALMGRSISANSAIINIMRVDVAAGWGQNLQLDWEAWTQ